MVKSASKGQTHKLISKQRSSNSSSKISRKSSKKKHKVVSRKKGPLGRLHPKIPRWLLIGGLGLLFLVIVLYFASIKLSFILQEEMQISLSPTDLSLTVHYNDSPTITFNTTVKNPRVCEFTCTYELVSLSDGTVLFNQTIMNQNFQEFNHTLPLDTKGSGQKLFNYKVNCHNIKSRICSTNEKNYFETSLISVNYDLSDAEKELKSKLESDLLSSLNTLAKAKKETETNADLLAQLNYVSNASRMPEEDSLLQQHSLDSNSLQSFESKERLWLRLWNAHDYVGLNNSFTDKDKEEIAALDSSIVSTQLALLDIAKNFNELLNLLETFKSQKDNLSLAATFYVRTNNYTQQLALHKLISQANNLAKETVTKNVTSFAKLFIDKDFFDVEQLNFLKKFDEDKQTLLSGAKSELELLDRTKIYLDKGGGSVPSITYTVNNLDDVCNIAQGSLPLTASFNQSQMAHQAELVPFLQANPLLKNATNNYLKFVLQKLNGGNASFILNTSVYGNISITINGTNTSYNLSALNQSDFAKITPINVSLIFHSFDMSYCLSNDTSSSNVTLVPEFSSLPSSLLTTVPDLNQTTFFTLANIAPQCCVYGVCAPCCDNNSCANENYPVLFVHGHAISKENRPEMSHEAFAKWQDLLEDDAYINAGQLAYRLTDIPPGDWGRASAPLTLRVSYYVLSYYTLGSYQLVVQKSDKIENYALRLHENIELIKERTGKNKVIIVAHSMGGLVVREYLSLFGEDSVDKFIMLGTPNYGIEGRVKRLCSVTGASRECTDMGAGSIFLTRLNVPQNTLTIPTYTIRALGCDMNGEDGDGIVLGSNVALPFAKNYVLHGKCTDSLNSNLHTKILDPDLYPETFDLVKNLIEGNVPKDEEIS